MQLLTNHSKWIQGPTCEFKFRQNWMPSAVNYESRFCRRRITMISIAIGSKHGLAFLMQVTNTSKTILIAIRYIETFIRRDEVSYIVLYSYCSYFNKLYSRSNWRRISSIAIVGRLRIAIELRWYRSRSAVTNSRYRHKTDPITLI